MVAAIAAVAALGSCSTVHTSLDRTQLYQSVTDLAAASSTVLIATAIDAEPSAVSGLDGAVTTFEVVANPKVGGHVATLDGVEAVNFSHGDLVKVRTLSGDPLYRDGFKTGKRYLLFLSMTGLDGDPANYFYVTGAGVGAFVQTDAGFTRLVADTPDSLPEVVSESDLG